KNKVYNFRMDGVRGALKITKEIISSRYLLLHTSGESISGELWKITDNGFSVTSRKTLENLGYPNPTQDNYMLFTIEKVEDVEFENTRWNFQRLKNFTAGRNSSFPFTASLSELMKNKIRST